MKILHLHWAFPPIIGGVESHLALLGPELVKNHCQVSLLTGAVKGEPEEESFQGMHVRRTPLMDLNHLNPQLIAQQAPAIKEEISKFIDRTKPDLLHAHNFHYFSPIHAEILDEIKTAKGLPLLLTAHNVWPDTDPVWQEMNQNAGIWDAVISVSRYIKKELVRAGYDAKTNYVVHHGVDLNRFGPAAAQEEEKIAARYPELSGRRVFFHPARMSLEKGCHISVKALALITQEFPEVLLVLAGMGNTVDWGSKQHKDIAQVMGLVDELKLRGHVYAGFFAGREMPLIYKAAEFCIYPSCFEEPFGLAMLESQASVKPIIVSKAGGMPEIIQDGINGFVVEMGSAEQLAERCLRLLRDPGLAAAMGHRGRTMVEQLWTKEIMTRATLDVYRQALAGKKCEH